MVDIDKIASLQMPYRTHSNEMRTTLLSMERIFFFDHSVAELVNGSWQVIIGDRRTEAGEYVNDRLHDPFLGPLPEDLRDI